MPPFLATVIPDQCHSSVPHFVNEGSEQVGDLVKFTVNVRTKARAKSHRHPSASVHCIAPPSLSDMDLLLCSFLWTPIMSIGMRMLNI